MSSAPWRLARWVSTAFVVVAAGVLPAVAQVTVPAPPLAPPQIAAVPEKPIPWLVFDARLAYPALGLDKTTATGLGVQDIDLPNRARSLVVGAHAYPMRKARLKLGVGAEVLMGSGSSQRKDASGAAAGPLVHRRISGVSGQVSLNFGRGAGWSYVTAGAGPFKFESYLDAVEPDSAGKTTINFGGGARWFNWDHVAFMVDLRFYRTGAASGTPGSAPRGPRRLVLFSAGFSLK